MVDVLDIPRNEVMTKILVTGVAGTGKTAVGRVLSRKGINTFDMDDVPGLCSWRNKVTGEKVAHQGAIDRFFIDSHDWICDVEHLQNLLGAQGDAAVALGVVSNELEVLGLFDKILLLQCNPETFINRVVARNNSSFGKEKSAQEFLLSFYKPFEDDLLTRGAVPINAEEPLDRVVRAVMSEIPGLPAGITTKRNDRSEAITARVKRLLTNLPQFFFG